jgi:hypothetical protein
MDVNPDTINKLIGAKVASYKDLADAKSKKEPQEDLTKKEDIHVNDTPYDPPKNKDRESKSIRELRAEDAFSFLTSELDDIYDDLEQEFEARESRVEDAYSFLRGEMGGDEEYGKIEDSYGGEGSGPSSDPRQSNDPNYIGGIQKGANRLISGAPKQGLRWNSWQKRRVRKHYDKARRDIVGNLAGEVARIDGRVSHEKAKEAALLGDSVAAPAVRSTASYLKRKFSK